MTAKDLEILANEQGANENAGLQLAAIIKVRISCLDQMTPAFDAYWQDNGETVLQVRHEAPKMTWRLVYSEEESSPPVEAILNVQGIIWNKDLPPFYEMNK